MQSVTWSPELYNIVRKLKRIGAQESLNLRNWTGVSISEQEKQAVRIAFAQPGAKRVGTLDWWS